MNHVYTTQLGFVHAVRYRDAMLRAWAKRTGHVSEAGWMSYKPEEIPAWLDVPTNEDRSRAEVYNFMLRPLQHGASYLAYLSKPQRDGARGAITTWMGELLAHVTKITSYNAVCFGRDAGMKGSFWAIGIDGRTYYGRHNGRGMFCRMRLAKWVDEFDIQQRTSEGWETVSCEPTYARAREAAREYRQNQPELEARIKQRRVRQV